MGEDLITNSIMYPVKDGVKIIKDAVQRRMEVLFKAKTVAEIGKLFDVEEYQNRTGDTYTDENLPELVKILDADLKLVSAINTNDDLLGRDSSYHGFCINGCEVLCIFAGEMTWGDTPDGYGYNILGAIQRLGIENELFKAIRWGVDM